MVTGKGNDKAAKPAAPGFIRSIRDVLLAQGPVVMILVLALSLAALFAPEIMGAVMGSD